MIELQHVSAGYVGHPVLDDISLSISPGTVTAIIGPNGCGKSTLLKTMAGLLPCHSGQIAVSGRLLSAYSPEDLAKEIAILPQGTAVPEITAGELVLHGRFPYLHFPRRYRPCDRQAARLAMETMGIASYQDMPMAQLSGGTRQKVYIAMALAQDASAILLDEPTTYLDIPRQLQLMQEIRKLSAAGKAVVLVLHDLNQALSHADQLIVLDQGHIAAMGTPEVVWASNALNRVFGIRLQRFLTEDGWHYYYREEES